MGLVVTVTHSQQGCRQRVFNKGLGCNVTKNFMALTPKKEKFAQCVASGMNQSDAYRAAYDVKPETTAASVSQQAYELMQNLDISLRIEHLRKPIAERVGRTLEQHIERMAELSRLALESEEFGASIKAEENVGKVLGYYVNKTELTGRNGAPIEHKITREIIDPAEDGASKD